MKAITCEQFGGPEVLRVTEVPDEPVGPHDIAIEVVATAVNRADTLQRQGYYPPPPGTSDIIGLECSGIVSQIGTSVTNFSVGDEVCALLAGGGYASRVVAPAAQVMPAPRGISLIEAASFPEVAATVWSNIMMEAKLSGDDVLLVHGGAGGLGTFAIQLAAARGHRVIATAGSSDKVQFCRDLGADVAINYRESNFVDDVRAATDGAGADVILDVMGASYLAQNISALATGGRLSIIGMQGGTKAELNIGRLMMKRAHVFATSLRPRPVHEKGAICQELVTFVWPLIEAGTIRPTIDTVLPLSEVADAHRRLEKSDHTGKIVLTV